MLLFNLCISAYLLFNSFSTSIKSNQNRLNVMTAVLNETTWNKQDCTHAIYPIEDFLKCDSDNDHFEEFKINLTTLETALIGSQRGLMVTYHNAGGDLIDFSIGTQFVLNQRTIIARATNDEGCFKETSFKLTLVSPPTAQKLNSVLECNSYILPTISQNNAYFTGINGSGRQLQSGAIIRTTQTIYIYAQRADCSDESEFLVTIKPSLCEETTEGSKINFVNFFTPNGDGINDNWNGVIDSSDWDSSLNTIEIYDRYGRFIFVLNSNSMAWDGKHKGNPLPSADYWYIANLTNGSLLSGHFTLKR